MVKHTQIIHRQQPRNCLSVFDHFRGLAPKALNLFMMMCQGAGEMTVKPIASLFFKHDFSVGFIDSYLWADFANYSGFSILHFKQVNAVWVKKHQSCEIYYFCHRVVIYLEL